MQKEKHAHAEQADSARHFNELVRYLRRLPELPLDHYRAKAPFWEQYREQKNRARTDANTDTLGARIKGEARTRDLFTIR